MSIFIESFAKLMDYTGLFFTRYLNPSLFLSFDGQALWYCTLSILVSYVYSLYTLGN